MAVAAKTMVADMQAEGAEVFVEMLNRQGVEYIFMNPGTDTVPIQEALAKFQTLGKKAPKVVLCLHEFVAMSAAHGHFMVSGKPQAVLVHVGVGTQQLSGALHNAHRSRVAVLLCAGTTPYTLRGDLKAGRTTHVHWLQDQFDQAGIVRDYVKWYYELKCSDHIQEVMPRAFQAAMSEPKGPVYLMLPKEVLTQKYEKNLEALEKFPPVISPEADSDALSTLARWLVDAERPMIMTGFSGRNTASVAPLVHLAETLGIAVIDDRNRMNYPSHHPCWQGSDPGAYITKADVILIIDSDVPYIPAFHCPSPGAKVAFLDLDPAKKDIPMWSFNADMLIQGDSAKSIPTLLKKAKELLTKKHVTKIQKRLDKLQAEHEARIARWTREAVEKSNQKPIEPEWLSHCINEVVDGETVVLGETVTNDDSVSKLVHTHQTGTYFKNGGAGLGWALGAALGAKLAAPDKTVISLVGDGAFLYGLPVATLWAVRQSHAPFLTIIYNNRVYLAPKRSIRSAYKEGFSQTHNTWVGVDIDPPPDYVLLAQSCGAYGERVEEPDGIMAALERALNEVRGGKAAGLDVVLRKP